MRAVIRKIEAALAHWFLEESGLSRHQAWLRANDLQDDDPVSFPKGKVIHILIEYSDEPEEP